MTNSCTAKQSLPVVIINTLIIGLHISIATVFWYFCERPFISKPLATVQPQN
jgi:hypothetical protein